MGVSVALCEPQLFGGGPIRAGDAGGGLSRTWLTVRSWVDHQQGWLGGSDELFELLVGSVSWVQHRRPMYQRVLDEPRLTAWFSAGEPWPHPLLGELSRTLSDRYGQDLGVLSLNLYRDGSDSVAWHGDRISRAVPEPVVAIVSLGPPRPFLLRPKGGGPSRSYGLGWGDLLVMGGRCQREFDHCVPKVARATPRLSVMFRPHDEGWTQRRGVTTHPVEVSR
ncbi:MAG: alpha-ketoglutarate-dependent dioxygenase AlkB [Acidimicrobiales bacterium]